MKQVILFVFTLFCTSVVFGQWTTKTDMINDARNHPVTFAIDGKGYVFTGYNTLQSFIYSDGYQYDPQSDSWTQLSNFPGGARGFAVGAAYNGKGYLGFGTDGSFLDDLWEYNPINETWTELATCPCSGRRHPAFTITSNGKIYVGLGDNASGGLDDWWEYDINNNTWQQQTDLPGGGRHHPYYFAIGTDTYVGFGHNLSTIFDDFYKFNSITKAWTTLNNFPGEGRVAGAQFAFNGFGYIVDGEGEDHQNLDDGELHRYDPNTDTWTTLASHSGDGLWAPGAFVIDSMVYVTGGDDDNDVSYSTLWAYSLEENPVDNAIDVNNDFYAVSTDFYDENASYQWVDCNNGLTSLLGETNASIEIPIGASYALVVTYSEGGIDTSACYQAEIPASINIGLTNSENLFDIYPNPSNDWTTIQTSNTLNEKLQYSIFNGLGKEVDRGRIGETNSTINLSTYTNGTYFLTVKGESGNKLGVKKLVIID